MKCHRVWLIALEDKRQSLKWHETSFSLATSITLMPGNTPLKIDIHAFIYSREEIDRFEPSLRNVVIILSLVTNKRQFSIHTRTT